MPTPRSADRSLAFHRAWWWLDGHPIFRDPVLPFHSHFAQQLDIYVAKVDPRTRLVEKDTKRNTRPEIWLESGPWEWPEDIKASEPDLWKYLGEEIQRFGRPSHAYSLDCGGWTFEEAILALARRVRRYYGDYDHSLWELTDAEVARTARHSGPELRSLMVDDPGRKPTPAEIRRGERAVEAIWRKRRAARRAAFAHARRVGRSRRRTTRRATSAPTP